MALCDLLLAHATVETLCWIVGVGAVLNVLLWGGQ